MILRKYEKILRLEGRNRADRVEWFVDELYYDAYGSFFI
ncbi:Uncharacterised protein [Listeria welshimeri]|nr:Uncharacterised protein [Listeria welshimeri]